MLEINNLVTYQSVLMRSKLIYLFIQQVFCCRILGTPSNNCLVTFTIKIQTELKFYQKTVN